MQQAKEPEPAGLHQLPADVTELQQRVAQLEIDNERLRQDVDTEKAGGMTPGTVIALIVAAVVVLGGGYVVARYVFHLRPLLSMLAAPLIFLALVLIAAIADWLGLLD